jgi:hypothetical protein
VATGWLGWTADQAMDTPLSMINLALEGRIDFLKKTNPWGSSAEDKAEEEFANRKPDPEGAARQLQAFFAALKPRQLPKRE